jgi:hypothetical protein
MRDAGVQLLIDHLDRLPEENDIPADEWVRLPQATKFAMLSTQEKTAILEQARFCTNPDNGFEYAARNYFWLINNESKDQLFSLWESQYLVLETMRKIKAQGKCQKIFVIKARRLGMSLLIEALIAWRTIFFRNINAIVVSTDEDSAAYLFGMMKHIYDKLPWWLQPEVASREESSSLVFDRRDPAMRGIRPGNQSQVMVQYATQFSGVGEGRRISACHLSEIAGMQQHKAQEIIEEDLTPAIHDTPENFAFIESTGKGTGNYTHLLWRACEKLGARSRWYPLFLGFFFETSRVISVPKDWKPQKHEVGMRERIKKEWLRCNDAACKTYHPVNVHFESMEGKLCSMCNRGTLHPVVLTNQQLGWVEDRRINAEATSTEAVRKFRQEFAATAEDSFQVSGYSVFDELCYEMVDRYIEEPIRVGFIGLDGKFHGHNPNTKRCHVSGCNDKHEYLGPLDEKFKMWREPVEGATYSVGVDVSEGIGQDYSVIFVNRVGGMHSPDEQVAVWSDNQTDPKELAFFANAIGRMYNDALMCVEYNVYMTTGDDLIYVYHYPNIYRWKNKESSLNVNTSKWHWWTKAGHKTTLYQNARYWMRSGAWIIHSKNFRHEMTTFVKEEYEDRTAGHTANTHDDELMAGLICLYCPHEFDVDPATGKIPIPGGGYQQEETGPKDWIASCDSCGAEWEASGPEEYYRCPATNPEDGTECSSIRLRCRRKVALANDIETADTLLAQLSAKTPVQIAESTSLDMM